MRRYQMVVLNPKRFVVVLWLIPAAAAQEFFRTTIERLAREFDAPLFEPHLTLGVTADSPDLPGALAVAPIQLKPLGIFWSASFTKTLFIRLPSVPELESLHDSLGITEPLRDPHLSLLYKKMPAKEKARLASRIFLPFPQVTFDLVQAVRCSKPTATRADVDSWEPIASSPLLGVA